jgi:hypothetical protein
LTQFTPRLTSAWASACVATTRLSRTPTCTPQPTPQNRHGAFDHLSFEASASVTMFCAPASSGTALVAAAAAVVWMKRRREIRM